MVFGYAEIRCIRFGFAEIRCAHFQVETFAKPVTDGASVARRHLGKSVMPCLKCWRRAAAVPFWFSGCLKWGMGWRYVWRLSVRWWGWAGCRGLPLLVVGGERLLWQN